MKRLNVLRMLLVMSLLLMSMLTFTPAAAGAPNHNELVFDEYSEINVCSFPIIEHQFGTIKYTEWFDANGQLLREFDTWGEVHETWSANGKTVSLSVSGPIFITYVSETESIVTFRGTSNILTLPGAGVVYGNAGIRVVKFIFDSSGNLVDFEVLKQNGLSREDWQAICKYLST